MKIFFINNGIEVVIKNETINFILPLEDLDDISKIIEIERQDRRTKY